LYDFLQTHSDIVNPPVLMINYERFRADEIARFKSLLEKKPILDGITLPKGSLVLAFISVESPSCYKGSGFQVILQNPLINSQLLPPLPAIYSAWVALETEKTAINLFQQLDWQSLLVGKWVLHQGVLTFHEGKLQKALQTGKAIEIQNGLWSDSEFVRFWEQIRRVGIWHAGRKIDLPPSVPLYFSDGYDDGLWTRRRLEANLHPGALVLNPGVLPSFFNRYEVQEGTLCTEPGFIKQYAHQELRVNLSRNLSKDSWAYLLDTCAEHQVTLVAHYFTAPSQAPSNRRFEVIVSSDIATTVACLTEKEPDWLVLSISSCEAHDLLFRLEGGLDSKSMQFVFTQLECVLSLALRTGQKIILKGRFSQSLVDALATLLIEQDMAQDSACLKVITADATAFSFLQKISQHAVSVEEKLRYLPANAQAILPAQLLATESLDKLRARMAFLAVHPEGNSDDAWIGMLSLPGGIVVSDDVLDLSTSAQKSELFMEKRREEIGLRLAHSPYVFITGLSGVGKTTFVQNELHPGKTPYRLFEGEQYIKAWAEDRTQAGSLLFLDEANLNPRTWDEFDGLFNARPFILIHGVPYPLTDKHRVIFAGNPLSYGDERQLSSFFKEHGAAVLFNPLSQEVIYEKILKPVFEGSLFNPTLILRICQPILNAYRFICNCSHDEVLISPRELQMMALQVFASYTHDNSISLDEEIRSIVYEIGQSLVPLQYKAEFERLFKPQDKESEAYPLPLSEAFVVTPSRRHLVQQLQVRLFLREWRIASAQTLNEVQKYGGLGGVVLEGRPGIGKRELLMHVLLASGYQEERNLVEKSTNPKPFYRMPMSFDTDKRKSLLLKAFEEGAIVLMDDMNSFPMMEDFLNDLLMGQYPKSSGKGQGIRRPPVPGFMIWVTQNPSSTKAGALDASIALKRRLLTVQLPDYTKEDLLDILHQKSVHPMDAKLMVEAYLERKTYAAVNGLPHPCLQDLLALIAPELPAFIPRKEGRKRVSASQVSSSFFNKQPHQEAFINAANRTP
jgi:hypothetical protein